MIKWPINHTERFIDPYPSLRKSSAIYEGKKAIRLTARPRLLASAPFPFSLGQYERLSMKVALVKSVVGLGKGTR